MFWYSILLALIFGIVLGICGAIAGIFSKPLSAFILNIMRVLVSISTASLYGQTFKKATENL